MFWICLGVRICSCVVSRVAFVDALYDDYLDSITEQLNIDLRKTLCTGS